MSVIDDSNSIITVFSSENGSDTHGSDCGCYVNGLNQGREKGLRQGRYQGRYQGRKQGRKQGYKQGYDEGVQVGMTQGRIGVVQEIDIINQEKDAFVSRLVDSSLNVSENVGFFIEIMVGLYSWIYVTGMLWKVSFGVFAYFGCTRFVAKYLFFLFVCIPCSLCIYVGKDISEMEK